MEQAPQVTDGYPEMRASLERRNTDPIEPQNQTLTSGLESLLDGLQSRLPARPANRS